MKKVIGWSIVVFALIGCATQEFTPVKDPTVRVESDGFSILPPPGPDWYRGPDLHFKSSDAVSFTKQAGVKTHTLAVTAGRHTGFDPASVGFAEYATKPEVFTEYVKATTQHMNPPGSRMRILELSAVPDTQLAYCVKEHAKFEDHGSSSAPQVLIQEDWTLTCLHPNSSRVIVEVVFSERGLPGESDPSLTNVREQFFKSLQFRPLQ
jgi:hypothetical protein